MKKVIENAKKVSESTIKKIVSSETSKSAKMKELFDLGVEIKEIAAIMEVRYNFVYNVISNYVTMNGIETESTKKVGKKDAIIELFLQGKSNKEIAIELKANYNYVFNTIKTYKSKNEVATETTVE